MSRTIKLEDRTFDKLERFRGKNETKSQAVERLLGAMDKALELNDILSTPRNSKEVDNADRTSY
ncbi:hypothetical protein ES708_12287 [subsurface metagenome]